MLSVLNIYINVNTQWPYYSIKEDT